MLGGEFRKLWVASGCSNLGDGVALVAAPLLAATLTGDPRLVAGLAFAQRLPWLLFPLLGGVLVDRLDRRRTMATVACCRALLIGGLGIAVLLERASLPLLYACFFLLSAAETLFDTAAATIVPAVVPRDTLPQANARLAGMLTLTNQFIGPPFGAWLFAVAAAVPFLLGAGGLAAAAALLLGLRGSFRVARLDGSPPRGPHTEVAEGLRWLWRNDLLRTIALAMAILNLTVVAQVGIMVLFARERLGLSAAGYGVLLTTYGLGGLLGSAVAGPVLARLGAGRALRLAIVIETAVPATIALTTDPRIVGVTLACFGCHATIWGALLTSLRQELTPDRLRGRVEGVYRFLESGTAAPGAILGGALAAAFGLAAPFWLGAFAGATLIPLTWAAFSEARVRQAKSEAIQQGSVP